MPQQEVGAKVILQRFGPLLFMLFMSMLLNWVGSAFEPAHEPSYKFAFQQSYTYPEK